MSALDLQHAAYELHFEPLEDLRHACAFPCDARGQVDMDGLDDTIRRDYLFARAVVGKVFRSPAVRPRGA